MLNQSMKRPYDYGRALTESTAIGVPPSPKNKDAGSDNALALRTGKGLDRGFAGSSAECLKRGQGQPIKTDKVASAIPPISDRPAGCQHRRCVKFQKIPPYCVPV